MLLQMLEQLLLQMIMNLVELYDNDNYNDAIVICYSCNPLHMCPNSWLKDAQYNNYICSSIGMACSSMYVHQ